MKHVFISLPLFIFVACFQSMLEWKPLLPFVDFIPVLLVLWSLRMESVPLAWLAFIGGVAHSILIPDAIGFMPLIWGTGVVLARSQRSFMQCYGYPYISAVVFSISLIYFSLYRLAFLASEGFWSWSYWMSLHIFIASLLNALVSTPFFITLKPLYRPSQKGTVFLTHVRT